MYGLYNHAPFHIFYFRKYCVLSCTGKYSYIIHMEIDQIKISNLTVPRSYFSEQNPWRYEYLTFFYITKNRENIHSSIGSARIHMKPVLLHSEFHIL